MPILALDYTKWKTLHPSQWHILIRGWVGSRNFFWTSWQGEIHKFSCHSLGNQLLIPLDHKWFNLKPTTLNGT